MPLKHSEDKVWFDEATKLTELCNEIAAHRESLRRVVVLSHFESTLAKLAAMLRERDITVDQFSSLNSVELCSSGPGKIWLGVARSFRATEPISNVNQSGSLEILVAEHHPLQSHDQAIIDAAGKLACQVRLCFYIALDDPLMEHFGVEQIKALLERLGMDRGECISNRMINSAIRNAQESIESKVGREVATQSPTDWFKYNLPK